jgi:hypothetical protein
MPRTSFSHAAVAFLSLVLKKKPPTPVTLAIGTSYSPSHPDRDRNRDDAGDQEADGPANVPGRRMRGRSFLKSKSKLSKAMTPDEFDNGYWYATKPGRN